MSDIHLTLFETRYCSLFSPPPLFWIAHGSQIGDWALNSDWFLQYNIVEGVATRLNICCMLEKMFDRNQNIFPSKNVEQMSSNMHATRSNIVDLINNCFITIFERVAGV